MPPIVRRIAILLFAAGACLALGSAAQAATTTWSTINLATADDGSPGLFLSTGPGDRVVLEPYSSGAPHGQWAAVYPEWPGAPTTTSNSPFATVWACIRDPGCPFTAQRTAPRKFVNRLTGRCLTLDNDLGFVRATIERCRAGGASMRAQVVEWGFHPVDTRTTIPRTETALTRTANRRALCIGVEGEVNVRGAGLRASSCRRPLPWHQRFRFLQVASITCTPERLYGICGLPAGWRP